ncbi:hypothetical protein KHA94_24055 [Bacillus sp. FJAT-49705]|uniref:Uncharacterized protein n=1 Tax=Cytobacillus citreus TaxID=2833586 RepID=A0ABS5P1C6_9BACI|nr:hypothetical protein [Cytobacillus citreus]MBS4193174.1 hypothetical protein [Cytobacillus citreus]
MGLIILLFLLILFNNNPAIAETKQLNPLESKLMSFMTGLHVGEPKQAVELWILGVNNRSGAVQYFHQ